MRQGNDVGTQYRSAIYTTTDAQLATRQGVAGGVPAGRHGGRPRRRSPRRSRRWAAYYYAEDYHQQYLSDSKNPYGYCNHGPNGMTCPIGVAKTV